MPLSVTDSEKSVMASSTKKIRDRRSGPRSAGSTSSRVTRYWYIPSIPFAAGDHPEYP